MINIRQFEKALKLTWIRTFKNETPDWSEFAYKCRINRLLQTDINYHNITLQKVHNQFWKSVTIGYTTFYSNIKKETPQQIELTPIWGNPDLQIEFDISLFRANVRFLQDLYSDNTRVSLNEFKNLTQTGLPFTYYLSLWKGIPRHMKEYMETRSIDYNLIYPTNISWFQRDKKGTQNIRKIMNKGIIEQTIGQVKWSDELALDGETDWQKLYLMAKNAM